ncbi:MAG: polysaccharide pyruvyl transferase family protein [Pelolinea sp.]|nr:polysaccharide pyruvyl transferase family protein [Pelolinea sp.]
MNSPIVSVIIRKFNCSTRLKKAIQSCSAQTYKEIEVLVIDDGPTEFLSLIEHAEFIVSSSFHGVAFLIIFKKQFYACLPTNHQRIASLLKILGIEDRLIRGAKDIRMERI